MQDKDSKKDIINTFRVKKDTKGILMHITSLPSKFGIGDLGPNAFRFIDFLKKHDQKILQILPLNPVDQNGCPYNSHSVFASNTLLISPEDIEKKASRDMELVSIRKEVEKCGERALSFKRIAELKEDFLYKKYQKLQPLDSMSIEEYKNTHSAWLDDYCLFMSLSQTYGLSWSKWPDEYKYRDKDALLDWENRCYEELLFIAFKQFFFDTQWQDFKQYANKQGIRIFGDLPIFVSYDSVDVWVNPHLFKLDKQLNPKYVAGVPPDYFSKTGQLWGNPVYDWERMKETNYEWWIKRIQRNFQWVDILRIDHFRGLEAFWQIPYGEKTAIHGKWVKGPGSHFLETVRSQIGQKPIIAEDLGMITQDVVKLRKNFNLPGMRVFQFAFENSEDNIHLPSNYPFDVVAYTGTHDNDTLLGWLQKIDDKTLKQVILFLEQNNGKNFNFDPISDNLSLLVGEIIESILTSSAFMKIIPLQDYMRLDSEARMNIPGTTTENWLWRFTWEELREKESNIP